MMSSEFFELSWSQINNTSSFFHDEVSMAMAMDICTNKFQLSPSISIDQNSSSVSYFPSDLSDDIMDFPSHTVDVHHNFQMEDLELEAILNGEIVDISGWLGDGEESFASPQQEQYSIEGKDNRWSFMTELISTESSNEFIEYPLITFPKEGIEIDNQLSLTHLSKAYGKAMEDEQNELAQVIMTRIREKVSPFGEPIERLLYYLSSQSLNKEEHYLKKESEKNFHAASKAFSQILPYQMFVHFTANSAILDSIPHDSKIVRIIDFDVREGAQWSSIIDALGQQQKTLVLTLIKWRDDANGVAPLRWRFEETKRRLYEQARPFGLKLKVEEMELHELMGELKRRERKREWLAFNCIVGLPNMEKRKRKHVIEFLRVAKEWIGSNGNGNSILTFGNGNGWEKFNQNWSGFGLFFNSYMEHYQALLESIESRFPVHLTEARLAIECLFVMPWVSCHEWIQNWDEMKECCDFQLGIGLKGLRMRNDSLMEAKELVNEKESLFRVRIKGESKNEMILEWNRTSLVRVSTWR